MCGGSACLREAFTDANESSQYSYIFPGQGSQAVGMGLELYQSSAAAKAVFQEADDSLDTSLSQLIFHGPADVLQDTVNSQPAIMTVSIACWRAWQEARGADTTVPMAVAGHSLGEYTSLVVSGVLDFSDGVKLVRERGRLMQQASQWRPGSMAAILGLDEFTLEQVCAETGVELANINTEDQIVISGDKRAVARAMDLSLARGAKKAIPLQVSGAFHSSLMYQAQQGLQEAISGLQLRDAQIPIIANSTGCPIHTADQVREELIRGLCQCVRWKASVEYMVGAGVSHFVEFGPGRVLSSLIKRIDRGVQAVTISDPEGIKKLAQGPA